MMCTNSSAFNSATTCLSEHLPTIFGDNLVALVLFGSCARAGGVIEGWSDIDILIIVHHPSQVDKELLREHIRHLRAMTGVGFTVIINSLQEVMRRNNVISPVNSVLLNTLSGRVGTSKILWGHIELEEPQMTIERANALSYVDHMTSQLRRFHAEVKDTASSARTRLAQAIRWTSSLVRAWLRSRGVFVLPYEESLIAASQLCAGIAFSDAFAAFALRRSWGQVNEHVSADYLRRLDYFMESFLERVL
jgi:hypothetical protein